MSGRKKLEKQLWKEEERRRRKINARIDRAVSFFAVAVCIVYAVSENYQAFRDLFRRKG